MSENGNSINLSNFAYISLVFRLNEAANQASNVISLNLLNDVYIDSARVMITFSEILERLYNNTGRNSSGATAQITYYVNELPSVINLMFLDDAEIVQFGDISVLAITNMEGMIPLVTTTLTTDRVEIAGDSENIQFATLVEDPNEIATAMTVEVTGDDFDVDENADAESPSVYFDCTDGMGDNNESSNVIELVGNNNVGNVIAEIPVHIDGNIEACELVYDNVEIVHAPVIIDDPFFLNEEVQILRPEDMENLEIDLEASGINIITEEKEPSDTESAPPPVNARGYKTGKKAKKSRKGRPSKIVKRKRKLHHNDDDLAVPSTSSGRGARKKPRTEPQVGAVYNPPLPLQPSDFRNWPAEGIHEMPVYNPETSEIEKVPEPRPEAHQADESAEEESN